ncbi:MAG: hypothetical protein R2825_12955 [Saprospiraceae bacterium]
MANPNEPMERMNEWLVFGNHSQFSLCQNGKPNIHGMVALPFICGRCQNQNLQTTHPKLGTAQQALPSTLCGDILK